MYRFGREEISAAVSVMESGRLFRYADEENSRVFRFERRFAQAMGASHAVLTSSGTAALICSLAALDIGPGDQVIVPGYTFIATALAVLAVGAVPVICEVDETLTIDVSDLERLIGTKTKAVIPVHMNGLPCRMDRVMEVARRRNIKVVEDACQATGGAFQGKRLGTFGSLGVYSFNQFKILTGGGGGAVIAEDRRLFERVFIMHDGACGISSFARNFQVPMFAGLPFRASEITGAILLAQLPKLQGIIKDLKLEKQLLVSALSESLNLSVAPCHDAVGDCGTHVPLRLESPDTVHRFCDAANAAGFDAFPADDSLHCYSSWVPVLEGRGGHHPNRNPFLGSLYGIDREACPRTLDIVGSTALLSVEINNKSGISDGSNYEQRVDALREQWKNRK